MDKIKLCAQAFTKLLDVEYRISLGKKGVRTDFVLNFDKKDFHHLIGFQKLKDLPQLQRDRKAVFDDILNDRITERQISSSKQFEKDQNGFCIRDRIDPLIHIESILDSNDIIFRYCKSKNPSYSLIEAEFLLKTPFQNTIIYIFLDDRGDGSKYCRSFFPQSKIDYTKNQMSMTLLRKEKVNTLTNGRKMQIDRVTPIAKRLADAKQVSEQRQVETPVAKNEELEPEK